MELSAAKRSLLENWLQGDTKPGATLNIPPRPLNSTVPLSFPQKRQLFLEMLERGTAVNHLAVFLEFRGRLDIAALEHSANHIIGRHEVLGTRFSFGQGMPAPEVLPRREIKVSIVDMQETEVYLQVTETRRLAEKELLLPFDLSQAPLIRLRLYMLSKEQYQFLIVAHHTIADGWSLGVLLKELLTCYQAIFLGRPPQLPVLLIQYADFAHWQNDPLRNKELQSSMAFWKNQLSGDLPVLDLPTDQPRGVRQNFSGGTHRFSLTKELSISMEAFSRAENVTPFMTLLSAFFLMLHRYSAQEDILVGTPVANRNFPELEHLIGVFINTIVLRNRLTGDPDFRELLFTIRDNSLQSYAHQELPFEQLVEELRPKRDLSRTPLFQVVFNLQNSPMPTLEIPGLEMSFLEINRGVAQFDLALIVNKSEGQYFGTVEYNDQLFTPATITRLFQSFQLLLQDGIARPGCLVSRLQVMDKAELHHHVIGFNQTQLDYPREKCVHQLFEEQVERSPDAVAVIFNDKRVTYLELNQRANQLARHLRQLGVGPGTRVGILMKKSGAIPEVLLAVLKAGGTYVPMHPAFPKERVQFMLKDAHVELLLTNINVEPGEEHKLQVIDPDEYKPSAAVNCANPILNIGSDDLAYIIYTSGSTGRPKGVMVQHSALVNFLWSMRLQPGINAGDVLLSVTAISFDIAFLELFLPLIAGATVVLASEAMTSDPSMMARAIDHYQVNILQATPASWQLLLATGWTGKPTLKALCGGESMARSLADQLLDCVGVLWNMYGPTETTVWSAIHQVKKGTAPITIGRPIANTQLYVLDSNLQPLPVGVAGELYIGGAGLSRGYLDDPPLTNKKFIPDCFSSTPGARLYKTGDYARYLPDYSIVVLGRMDEQVKINGHRVELGEIASVLMEHASVQQAIAIAPAENNGEKRLAVYYVPKQGESPGTDELQAFLRLKLPAYMAPAIFIQLDEFGLTSNGKIDRNLLPVPGNIQPLPGYTEPRNKEEQLLAGIWQDVLGVTPVGIHDNFFELGGASIQCIQVVAKANLSGVGINIENIFEYQTIAGLAAGLKGLHHKG